MKRKELALALSGALMLGYWIATVQAHDPRLDEAFQALQKAGPRVRATA